MLLRLYRGIGPGTIVVIVITAVLVWLQAFLNPPEPSFFHDQNPAPLYELILGLFKNNALSGVLFSFVLVLIIGIYLVNFNTRLFFINERTFLPASLFVIFSGYIASNQVLNPVLPATFLLLVATDRIIGSYRKSGVAFNYFDASLLIGIASLIYINTIWFWLLVIIGMALLRSINLRELFISILGLILPFIILYSFYYLTGRDITSLNEQLISAIVYESPGFYWSPVFIALSALNSIIVFISLLHLWSMFNTKKVRSRKIFALLIWLLFLTIGVYILVPSVSIEMMTICLVPLVYILTHYLVVLRNKKIANILFAILLLSVLFSQIM